MSQSKCYTISSSLRPCYMACRPILCFFSRLMCGFATFTGCNPTSSVGRTRVGRWRHGWTGRMPRLPSCLLRSGRFAAGQPGGMAAPWGLAQTAKGDDDRKLLSIPTPHAGQAFSKEHGLGRRRTLPGFYLPNRHPALMQTTLLAIFLIVNIISVPCERRSSGQAREQQRPQARCLCAGRSYWIKPRAFMLSQPFWRGVFKVMPFSLARACMVACCSACSSLHSS